MDRDGFISNGELFLVLKMMVGNNLKVRRQVVSASSIPSRSSRGFTDSRTFALDAQDQQLQQIVDKSAFPHSRFPSFLFSQTAAISGPQRRTMY